MEFSTRLYDDGDEFRVAATIRTPEILTDLGKDKSRTLVWDFHSRGQALSFAEEIHAAYPNMEVSVKQRVQYEKWNQIAPVYFV